MNGGEHSAGSGNLTGLAHCAVSARAAKRCGPKGQHVIFRRTAMGNTPGGMPGPGGGVPVNLENLVVAMWVQ